MFQISSSLGMIVLMILNIIDEVNNPLLSLSEKAIATTLIHRKIYWFDLIWDFLLGNKVAIAF